jgi:hypothetical protein
MSYLAIYRPPVRGLGLDCLVHMFACTHQESGSGSC